MSGALKDFNLAYAFKSLRQTCALEDFDTVWRARVEVYINATGEFSVCKYACMFQTYIHTCLEVSDIHTCILGGLRHTYIHTENSAVALI